MDNSTICAISTPIGTGGISIIRMSGVKALDYALNIFSSKGLTKANIKPRYFYLGNLKDNDINEKCMMVYFRAPYSYTGEDIVEFQCHGGVLLTKKILAKLVDAGATLAEAGEFTKRAFVNGKLSLDEAEGVIDVINAESDSELKAGFGLMRGNLHNQIDQLQSRITDILSAINVTFDFPENDDEAATSQQVLHDLSQVRQQLNQIIDTSKTGIKLKEGNRILILGKPNVGKSSIMNAFLGTDRAIVTSIQGTTRDVLEETYIYNGVKFILTDTAGLHDSVDEVESIGIAKAKGLIDSADIILFVVDNNSPIDNQDKEIIKLIADKKYILVVNKVDKQSKINISQIPFDKVVRCSTISGQGIMELKQLIYDTLIDDSVLGQNIIITSMRHAQALQSASNIIDDVINDLHNNADLELISLNLQSAWTTLGQITGVSSTEEIVSNIFSKFCVGK